MSCLHYRDHALFIEHVSLTKIAEEYGTPCYVYSKEQIINNARDFANAFGTTPHQLCYAVKANSNIAILRLLANLDMGFDIVSGGELKRVMAAGGDIKKVVFSGVGKSIQEIEEALHAGIFCFNIESESELERLHQIAGRMQISANIMLRINPNVDAKTHAHISTGMRENKFGMDASGIVSLTQRIQSMPVLHLIGIGMHIGSQITELAPFLLALDQLLLIYQALKEQGITLEYLNIGGGLGITYHHETPPSVTEYAEALQQKLKNSPVKLILEPGRAIVGNAGILLTRIEYIKSSGIKNFAITDAGMNDLLRPALYNAWQNILPVIQHQRPTAQYDITGPVCESSDFLGKDRHLAIQAGELLVVDCAGAYGFSMSSNYNSRCRPAEILVSGHQSYLIRRRETIEDALALEKIVMERL